MSVDHLLYLHGFRSSPASAKARQTRMYIDEHHPTWTWCCPQLNVSPRAAMAQVQALCADWPKERTAVIGSSLGGFYATHLGLLWGCRTVLINPAVHPQAHGEKLVGEFPLWHDPDQMMRFEPHHLSELAELDRAELPPWPDCMTWVGTHDEVLDPQTMHDYYRETQFHWVAGADHAMADYPDLLPQIDAFLCAPQAMR